MSPNSYFLCRQQACTYSSYILEWGNAATSRLYIIIIINSDNMLVFKLKYVCVYIYRIGSFKVHVRSRINKPATILSFKI